MSKSDPSYWRQTQTKIEADRLSTQARALLRKYKIQLNINNYGHHWIFRKNGKIVLHFWPQTMRVSRGSGEGVYKVSSIEEVVSGVVKYVGEDEVMELERKCPNGGQY